MWHEFQGNLSTPGAESEQFFSSLSPRRNLLELKPSAIGATSL